jgi:cell wall-associated NlpC family hydrolase
VRRIPDRTVRFPLVIAAVVSSLLFSSLASAAPTNTRIEAKRAEARAARTALDDLNDQFEMKVEEFNAVTESLERTRADIDKTRVELASAETRLAESEERLSQRVRAIYTGGGEIGMVEVLLGTSTFDDFLTRVDLLNRISASDAALVSEVTTYRDKVAASAIALENREAEQVALRQEADAKKRQVEAALKRQQEYLSSLNAEVQKLVREEEERQRRIAEELARRAAAEAAKRKAAPRTGGGSAGTPHPEAVDVALRYIGVPYVWGGSSPSGFDCSGLTHYAYAQLGIHLPRTSSLQYHAGAFIEASRLDLLQPGDLVFFGYDGDPDRVHHVGMYVGSGNFVHAPATGDRVKVSSLTDRIASRQDYVGAIRP